MDYTQQRFGFNLRKAIRYGRLYGPGRTLMKVRAQYHMKRAFPGASAQPVPAAATGKHVGILGCGKFAYANVAYYLRRNFGNVIRGVMDIDLDRAVSLGRWYRADYYTTDADAVIHDPHIDLIYIVSNHASHAEYAIRALQAGKAVHIEKPHAVSEDQLYRLCDAIRQHNGRVRLGFNRPDSPLGRLLHHHLRRQAGPAMINWFVAGHALEAGHWYFAGPEGGRVLGNLCHWIDFTLRLIPAEGRFPIRIVPTRSAASDGDVSVSYVFGDGSIGTITFSAKGHTFEGVRETLNAHRGNLLVSLRDFHELRLDEVGRITRRRLRFRNHGHQQSVVNSYRMLHDKSLAEDIAMIWNSGYLTLRTKEALDTFTPAEVTGYAPSLFTHPLLTRV